MSRPMLNLTTAVLCERIACADVAAAREAVIRLSHGVRPHNARKLRMALSNVVIDDAPAPVVSPEIALAPVAEISPEVSPVAEIAPAPMGEISPEVLAQLLGDQLAGAVALVLAQQGGQVSTPVPVPAPVVAPEPKTTRKAQFAAANLLAKRVSALKAAERRELVARAKAHALDSGLTLADVETLSDEACLALLAG